MTKDDNAGGSSAPRRRRRRRSSRGRGRGGGQRSGGKPAQSVENSSGDAPPKNTNQQNKQNKQNKQDEKQHNRKSRNKSRKRNNSHNSRGRNAQRRKSGGGNKRRSNGSHLEHSDLPLSVETSAGGLVLSGLAEAVQGNGYVDLSKIYVALIGRLDRRGRLLWSMPKGHIENDESKHATAEREVWEETGIAGEVIADLGTIDYWFVSDGTRIHKTVHHHLLRFIDGDLNDEDPEVTEVSWVPVSQLVERLAYADERRLARRAFDTLPNFARKEAEAGRLTPR